MKEATLKSEPTDFAIFIYFHFCFKLNYVKGGTQDGK